MQLVKTTPTQLRLLRRLVSPTQLAQLEAVFVIGGEQLMFEDCAWLCQAREIRIHNEYGPTEATVGCFNYAFEPGRASSGPVPIGVPHRGTEVHLRRVSDNDDVSVLVLAGLCLADGYLGEDQGGFFDGADGRRYDTGDLVRIEQDQFVYVGRSDRQVKHNGYRVDLGEIEALIVQAGIVKCAVTGMTDGRLWLAVEDTVVDKNEVLQRVRAILPRQMWPSKIVALSHLPMTSHGKLDTVALATAVDE